MSSNLWYAFSQLVLGFFHVNTAAWKVFEFNAVLASVLNNCVLIWTLIMVANLQFVF
jgi:uncharacterized protein YybS (DUF2232 family)